MGCGLVAMEGAGEHGRAGDKHELVVRIDHRVYQPNLDHTSATAQHRYLVADANDATDSKEHPRENVADEVLRRDTYRHPGDAAHANGECGVRRQYGDDGDAERYIAHRAQGSAQGDAESRAFPQLELLDQDVAEHFEHEDTNEG